MAYPQKVKDSVREARIKEELTIDALSKRFDIPRATIQTWVKGLPRLARTRSGNSWRNNPWKIITKYYYEKDVVLPDLLKKFSSLTQSAISRAVKEGVLLPKSRAETMKILHKLGRHPGWAFNGRVRRSYPEEFFHKGLLLRGLYDKYVILEKFSLGRYWLDFAIVDHKIDVEIDGQQHFTTQKAIKHDEKRDEFVKSCGWRVYRISWKEFSSKPDQVWADLLEFLRDKKAMNSRRYSTEEARLSYPKNSRKYGSRADYFSAIRDENLKSYEAQIDLVKSSGIDFSKLGWVQKVADLIGKKSQHTRKWVRLYMPEVHKNAYKRKQRNHP